MQAYPTPDDEFEPASPEAQRAAIEAAMIETLGENWHREWLVVHNAHDLVRVNKDEKNIDFQADLLANVEIIEREANPVQLSGRLIAWMVLGAFLFLALAIATIAGIV